ncbi:MAG: hypothetical protein FWD25_08015 [Clostridia bacterium]|nr:hypothetical protein [Clostridia bacterium]
MGKHAEDIYVRMCRLTPKIAAYIDDFDCGNQNLNQYVAADRHDASTVGYLFLDDKRDNVISYASVACAGVMIRGDIPGETFVDNENTTLSAMEIKIFATAKQYQHMKMHETSTKEDTLSSRIFRQTLFVLRNISVRHIGSKGVVVYSVPKAVSFYERHGFFRFSNEMTRNAECFLAGCVPMIMPWV